MIIKKAMKRGDNGVTEINTAPLVGSRTVEVPFDQLDLFLMSNEEETDISDLVTIIDDDDVPYLEEDRISLEFTSSSDLFVENCLTCVHSESEKEGNNIILPSGCKQGVPIRSNVPRYCEQFKQFS